MHILIKLAALLGIFLSALIGTVAGNLLRMLLGSPKERQKFRTPSGEWVITGVLTNSAIALLVGLLTGKRRARSAFLNGAALTALVGDRLDRQFLGGPYLQIREGCCTDETPETPASDAGRKDSTPLLAGMEPGSPSQ